MLVPSMLWRYASISSRRNTSEVFINLKSFFVLFIPFFSFLSKDDYFHLFFQECIREILIYSIFFPSYFCFESWKKQDLSVIDVMRCCNCPPFLPSCFQHHRCRLHRRCCCCEEAMLIHHYHSAMILLTKAFATSTGLMRNCLHMERSQDGGQGVVEIHPAKGDPRTIEQRGHTCILL